jgi:hypothetical protein
MRTLVRLLYFAQRFVAVSADELFAFLKFRPVPGVTERFSKPRTVTILKL